MYLPFSLNLSPQSDIKVCDFYCLQSFAMPEVEPFKSVKTKLTNILQSDRAEETLSHIEDAVHRTNDIVRHAYQLLKLFLIHNSTHPVDDKLVKILSAELLFSEEGQSQRQS